MQNALRKHRALDSMKTKAYRRFSLISTVINGHHRRRNRIAVGKSKSAFGARQPG